MKIYGKIIRDTKIIKAASYENKTADAAFSERLEDCLINVCKRLDIPVPLWLEKNTKEFARFRTTGFQSDQFMENVTFDRLEIRVDF